MARSYKHEIACQRRQHGRTRKSHDGRKRANRQSRRRKDDMGERILEHGAVGGEQAIEQQQAGNMRWAQPGAEAAMHRKKIEIHAELQLQHQRQPKGAMASPPMVSTTQQLIGPAVVKFSGEKAKADTADGRKAHGHETELNSCGQPLEDFARDRALRQIAHAERSARELGQIDNELPGYRLIKTILFSQRRNLRRRRLITGENDCRIARNNVDQKEGQKTSPANVGIATRTRRVRNSSIDQPDQSGWRGHVGQGHVSWKATCCGTPTRRRPDRKRNPARACSIRDIRLRCRSKASEHHRRPCDWSARRAPGVCPDRGLQSPRGGYC